MRDRSSEVHHELPAVKDHNRQYEDFVFVYPVISRRSGGLSLGVNLNPDKRCNFDCVYCEVDRRTPGRADSVDLARADEELRALVRWVKKGGLGTDRRFSGLSRATLSDIRDIAFSGDGEPTMVPNFADCVRMVIDVKQAEELGESKIVLITDGAGLDKVDVRKGLEWMHAHQGEVWAKLDAGTEDYYRRVNRSHVRFDRILKNLTLTAQAHPIVIQTLFLKIHDERMSPGELSEYCRRLGELREAGGAIREVHAYTVARPTPEAWATRLSAAELEETAVVVRESTGLTVRTFP